MKKALTGVVDSALGTLDSSFSNSCSVCWVNLTGRITLLLIGSHFFCSHSSVIISHVPTDNPNGSE